MSFIQTDTEAEKLRNAIALEELDVVLMLQFVVSWAGEGKGLTELSRLNWWSTQLLDVEKSHSRLLRMSLAVEESREYWEHNDSSLSKKDIEIIAFEKRWFGNKSLSRVRTILRNFSDRFDVYPIALEVLQQWCPSELATRQNICHWHLQLSDPIYRQFSGVFLEQRRASSEK